METVITVYYANRLGEERRAWFLNGMPVMENEIARYVEIGNRFNDLHCFLKLSQFEPTWLIVHEERLTDRSKCF
jgi:hypothetical protein